MWTENFWKRRSRRERRKENEKKTMTGKPVSKVDVTPTTDEKDD